MSVAAAGVATDVATLAELARKGWITTVEKNGTIFLAADQRYKAKYVIFLRNKKQLSDEQIELVLSIQEPPYSAAKVDEILAEYAPAPVPSVPDSEPAKA